MDLVPSRRGCLHYGTLALCLFMAICGVGVSIWGGYQTTHLWRLEIGNIPHPSTEEVRKAPESSVKWIQEVRERREAALESIAYFCTGFVRFLGVVAVLALFAALTTPGRPRFLRFVDWQGIPDLRRTAWLDFGIAMASLLLFASGFLAANALRLDLSRPPVLPPDGGEVSRMLAAEAARTAQTFRIVPCVAGIAFLLLGTISYRIARRLWGGFRAEQKRRRAEANALTVRQF